MDTVSTLDRVSGIRYRDDMPSPPTLGARIRKAREHRGYSQWELARLTGCSQGNVSDWERGAYRPRLDRVIRLARALRLPVARLLAGLRAD